MEIDMKQNSQGPKATKIILTERQEQQLEKIAQSRSHQHSHVVRARIILNSAKNVSNEKIALELRIDRKTARRWRNRWAEISEKLTKNESDISDKQLEQMINDILSDNPRPGNVYSRADCTNSCYCL